MASNCSEIAVYAAQWRWLRGATHWRWRVRTLRKGVAFVFLSLGFVLAATADAGAAPFPDMPALLKPMREIFAPARSSTRKLVLVDIADVIFDPQHLGQAADSPLW